MFLPTRFRWPDDQLESPAGKGSPPCDIRRRLNNLFNGCQTAMTSIEPSLDSEDPTRPA